MPSKKAWTSKVQTYTSSHTTPQTLPLTEFKLSDQEELITTLSSRDTSSTTIYTYVLLILPLSPILLYIPKLFALNTCIPSLAAILSLLASAYTLFFLPLPPQTNKNTTTPSIYNLGKGKAILRDESGLKAAFVAPETRSVPYVSADVAELLRMYLIPVNAAVCVILVLWELSHGREWREGMMIGGGYVPLFIGTVILWARRELRVVDLGELERLRYRGKGA
jgi:hypothetical protein